MLEDVYTAPAFYVHLVIPMIIAIILGILVARHWKNGIGEGRRFNVESFRNPLNATLALVGVLIPVISTAAAYLAATTQLTTLTLAPLAASSIVLTFVILLTLWNLYSLATLADENERLVIDKDHNLYFPAVFVAQLTLLFCALVSISYFLLVDFKLTGPAETAGKIVVHGS